MAIEIGEVGSSQKTLFEELGGEETIRNLVERFYDVMDTDERAIGIRKMHSVELTEAREKLFMFLVGWSGGLSVINGCFVWCVRCMISAWKSI